MKRGRGEVSAMISIADYMILLSHTTTEFGWAISDSSSRIFECKTCHRQFSSFQALGGHRASHKKQKMVETALTQASPPKPKTHECKICGLEFAVGQSLGGHMRRHKTIGSYWHESTELTLGPSLGQTEKENNNGEFLCLDLNLTPRENGLDFHLNNMAPKVLGFL